jgi:hypothetical protein
MYYSGTSTGYTEVIAVDDSHILCVYDRTPLSSSQTSPTPAKNMENPDLGETYSVWAVWGTLTRN